MWIVCCWVGSRAKEALKLLLSQAAALFLGIFTQLLLIFASRCEKLYISATFRSRKAFSCCRWAQGKRGNREIISPQLYLFSGKKTKKTRAQNCGESMLTVFYPSTPDEYRQRWEHLFRVSPHPGGQGLTPAWTICCISCASFGFVTLFHKIFHDQIKWTFKNRVKEGSG